jgi:hypothetical protein
LFLNDHFRRGCFIDKTHGIIDLVSLGLTYGGLKPEFQGLVFVATADASLDQ